MPDALFTSVLTSGITAGSFAACTTASLIFGLVLSLSHMFKNSSTKSYAVTVALLPLIVQTVIMLVNGNLGTGVAVAGAFSLVRFRSVPGSAKEILNIFMAMAAGLGTGVGYIGLTAVFVLAACGTNILFSVTRFGEQPEGEREIRITVPESLNYTDEFDELFKEYTAFHRLKKVKTSNMGSLYQLTYTVRLKNPAREKELIDSMRCRNGNLDIISSRCAAVPEEL